MPGTLFVINAAIGGDPEKDLPLSALEIIHSLELFLAERSKTCRAFLKAINHPKSQAEIEVLELDKHHKSKVPPKFFDELLAGRRGGLISEAGSAGVLDAGTEVVDQAIRKGISVKPLIGPSSIILALMASGLNGQTFCIHGYLPIKFQELKHRLHLMERESMKHQTSQVFIETPYRNLKTYEYLCKCLQPETKLCIAAGLTTEREFIATHKIKSWNKMPVPPIHKIPAVFIFQVHS
jgi:16S rRNA (cytidine1402-2'-O)-methyltransferase